MSNESASFEALILKALQSLGGSGLIERVAAVKRKVYVPGCNFALPDRIQKLDRCTGNAPPPV